jgi:hypothetical protein
MMPEEVFSVTILRLEASQVEHDAGANRLSVEGSEPERAMR